MCDSLIYCFWTLLNNGARSYGGIGNLLLKRSKDLNPGFFYSRIIYDLLFYFLIIIILLHLVFGMIFENFRQLRIEYQENTNDKQNVCFICGAHKDDIENDGNNFEQHREKEHNLWNYVYYIIGLKFSELQDLNAINSVAYSKIEKGMVNWFPKYVEKRKKFEQ